MNNLKNKIKSIKLNINNTIVNGFIVNETKNDYIIKLNSGYNIILNKNDKKIIEIFYNKENKENTDLNNQNKKEDNYYNNKIEDNENNEDKKKIENYNNKEKNNKKIHENKPYILILHTGGTIASRVDYKTGAVFSKFDPKEIIELFPELKELVNIDSKLISNILSENMRFEHYNVIAKEIKKALDLNKYKTIIITHGTDTMHYTSCALGFMLNTNIPIILVGSQRSSDRGSSDAFLNLINAIYFGINTDLKGIFIAMHETTNDDYIAIHNGFYARKMHTSSRDAFKSINNEIIARVNYKENKIKYISKNNYIEKDYDIKLFNPNLKIGMLYVHPNLNPEEILCFKDFDGLIVIGTGIGNFPTDNDNITDKNKQLFDLIKEISKKTLIVMCSQTIYGRINMNVYATGRKLLNLGILGNLLNLTPECAFIKLSFLLSNYPKEKTKELFNKNLFNEINNRSLR